MILQIMKHKKLYFVRQESNQFRLLHFVVIMFYQESTVLSIININTLILNDTNYFVYFVLHNINIKQELSQSTNILVSVL